MTSLTLRAAAQQLTDVTRTLRAAAQQVDDVEVPVAADELHDGQLGQQRLHVDVSRLVCSQQTSHSQTTRYTTL